MNTPNFSDIYTLYFEDVYKYLLALCHDEELAEELAQDTFFKAMKSYISVLRTVIKEELSDGETEIMNYGFNHEKKDYIAVYYGTPNNCELIWKKGDLLPTAPKDIFE